MCFVKCLAWECMAFGVSSSHLQTYLQILKDRFPDQLVASNVSAVTLLSHASLCKGDPHYGSGYHKNKYRIPVPFSSR